MYRLQNLEKIVMDAYALGSPDREEWAEWLAEHHVLVVADYATKLAEQYGADTELSRAAALLHDVADIKMKRADPNHEQESFNIARAMLEETGFSDSEIKLIVDDAIRYHGCHGEERPVSLEGKVLATADALAHLRTDFYVFATRALGKQKSLDEIKDWVLKKIERDFYNKIAFDEIRNETEPDYLLIKNLFSR